jgi:hypothetical protein
MVAVNVKITVLWAVAQYAMGLLTEESEFGSWQEIVDINLFSITYRLNLGLTQPPIHYVSGMFPRG